MAVICICFNFFFCLAYPATNSGLRHCSAAPPVCPSARRRHAEHPAAAASGKSRQVDVDVAAHRRCLTWLCGAGRLADGGAPFSLSPQARPLRLFPPSTAPPLQARAPHPGFQVRQRLGLGERRPSLLSAASASSRVCMFLCWVHPCRTS